MAGPADTFYVMAGARLLDVEQTLAWDDTGNRLDRDTRPKRCV